MTAGDTEDEEEEMEWCQRDTPNPANLHPLGRESRGTKPASLNVSGDSHGSRDRENYYQEVKRDFKTEVMNTVDY